MSREGDAAGTWGPDVHRFDRFARPYEWVMPSADGARLRSALATAERDVHRALDVAGGPGRAARSVPGVDWTVVDAAPGMTRRARANGFGAVQGDAARLPVADEGVDAVVVTDALHHVADRVGTVRSVARVLRPGGVFVVRDFDPTTLRGRGLVLAERLVRFDSRFYTPDELVDVMADAGLDAEVHETGFTFTVCGVKPMGDGATDDRSVAAEPSDR